MNKNLNITKINKNKNYYNLNYNYIAGLVHANGTFTATLIKGKYKIYINPRFILTQYLDNKEIIYLIKEKLNNLGHIKIQTNNIIKYNITNLKDIHNIILPIFDKYQVRSNKYLSYLKFKLLVKILYNEKPKYKSSLWLFCIMLKIYINPLVKPSKQLKYLNKEEQNIIINKLIPNDINYDNLINKYCPELLNINIFNSNHFDCNAEGFDNSKNGNGSIWYKNEVINRELLTIDFINGLIDGAGSLSLSLKKNKNNNRLSWAANLEIIQDYYNYSILEEIHKFFNCGKIVFHKSSVSYLNSNPKEIYSIITKITNYTKDNNYDNFDNLTGPKIKLYKFYNFILIYELIYKTNNTLQDQNILNEVIKLIYNTRKNSKNLTLEEFKSFYIN